MVTVWRGMALFLQTTLAPGARVAAVQLAVPCPAVSLTLVSATFSRVVHLDPGLDALAEEYPSGFIELTMPGRHVDLPGQKAGYPGRPVARADRIASMNLYKDRGTGQVRTDPTGGGESSRVIDPWPSGHRRVLLFEVIVRDLSTNHPVTAPNSAAARSRRCTTV